MTDTLAQDIVEGRAPEWRAHGRREALRWAVTYIHNYAAKMNDPSAKAALDTCAMWLGTDAKKRWPVKTSVAQRIERPTPVREVAGSNPAGGAIDPSLLEFCECGHTIWDCANMPGRHCDAWIYPPDAHTFGG